MTTQSRREVLKIAVGGLILGTALVTAAPAVAYPERPVELVVPFAPGGVTDLVARQLADYLSKEWGQPISIVNRSGGSGIPGVVSVLSARPDGYTMLMYSISVGALNPASQKDLPYQWDDPTLVARTNVSPIVFAVNAESPYETVQDFLDAVRADPTSISYGTSGPVGTGTLAMAQIFDAAGVDPTKPIKVVYEGGAPAVTALAGGHIDAAAQNLPEVLEMAAAGKIRLLAVTTEERLKDLPDVPTAAEAGVPEFKMIGWNGIAGPAGLPDEVAAKWNEGVQQALADPALQQRLEELGTVTGYLAPGEFKQFIQEQYEGARDNVERLGL